MGLSLVSGLDARSIQRTLKKQTPPKKGRNERCPSTSRRGAAEQRSAPQTSLWNDARIQRQFEEAARKAFVIASRRIDAIDEKVASVITWCASL